MKKALIISNQVRKIPGGMVETIINPLKELGYECVWAANFNYSKLNENDYPCEILKTKSRSLPFHKDNLDTYKIIFNYIKNNKVDLIFCSTPIGGLIGRLLSKKYKIKTIYQAHGFLFFKGGPKLGFAYKLLEKHLARYTDVLITINNEDFENAKKFKLRNNSKDIYMVHGSGVNFNSKKLSIDEIDNKKKELGIDNQYVFISVGELNKNKNVLSTVKAFNLSNIDNFMLLICGEGKEDIKIRKYIEKHHLNNKVKLLGYRLDVNELMQISNCYISSSLREGLSRTVLEAMSCGLPCLVSNKRGLSDLVDDNKGGYLFEPKNIKDIASKMIKVSQIDNKEFSKYNLYHQWLR